MSRRYDHRGLKRLVELCFSALGFESAAGRSVASNLVLSNLKGMDSHGIGYLPRYVKSAVNGGMRIGGSDDVLVSSAADSAVVTVDGRSLPGQVVGPEAMKAGVEAAQRHGVSVVATRNSHHLGRIGAWAEICAELGFASVHFTNVHGSAALVAPHGSTPDAGGGHARLGTNPVCIGIPSGPHEGGELGASAVVVDFATSVTALGNARNAANAGRKLEPGALLDAEGNPTCDPSVMFGAGGSQDRGSGALLPAAQHKGFGLALACEILGAMCGGGHAATSTEDDVLRNSMLSFVVDPTALKPPCEGGNTSDAMDEILRYVRAAPGDILFPGEKEERIKREREALGIPLDAGTVAELVKAAAVAGVQKQDVETVLRQAGK